MRPVLLTLVLWAGAADAQCERTYRQLLGTSGGFPQYAESVDDALTKWLFVSRFSSFVNSRFNKEPSARHGKDPAWYVIATVLGSGRPWKDVFVGHFNVPDMDFPTVQEDPNGLGYFTSPGWRARYAGNEKDGLMLVAASRILQNTIGLKRVAAANNSAAGVPNDATGRMAAGCTGCHFTGPYALDYVARLLPRKQVTTNGQVQFTPAPHDAQPALGTTLADERALVEALVASDAFKFWSCRLAFEFVYGRDEYACDAPLFDRCVDAFTQTGRMQTAVKTLIEDPGFCQ